MIYIDNLTDTQGCQSSLLYIPVPKIACTTVKTHLYFVQNKVVYKPQKLGMNSIHIHNLSPTLEYQAWRKKALISNDKLMKAAFKFCIVRNPIQRVLSCLSNRIVYLKDLAEVNVKKKILAANLQVQPDLDFFINNLSRYIDVSASISHHAGRLVDYLGTNAYFYDQIFDISEIDSVLVPRLRELSSCNELKLKKLQSGGPKIDKSDLTSEQTNAVRTYFEQDFQIYSDFFKS